MAVISAEPLNGAGVIEIPLTTAMTAVDHMLGGPGIGDQPQRPLSDIETGLIDFPALANGRPIWLCWRCGEDGIGWWHDVNVGFAGRRPLIELE